MGDNLRGQKKDVSKYSLDINSDGTLTFHSDGYPDMMLTPKSVAASAAPSGKYEGSVPFIMDVTADFKSAAACDFAINVKLAHLDFKCPAGPAALSATAVTFSNITSAGGYMSDNFQGQKKTVFKYALILTLVTLGPSAAATTLTLSSPRSL